MTLEAARNLPTCTAARASTSWFTAGGPHSLSELSLSPSREGVHLRTLSRHFGSPYLLSPYKSRDSCDHSHNLARVEIVESVSPAGWTSSAMVE